MNGLALAPAALWGLGVALMTALWLIQQRTRNAGIVDFGWAALLGLGALLYAATGEGDPLRRVLVAVMGGGWGLRLAHHLLTDRVLGRPEEGRYVTLREKWAPQAARAFLVFFQAQAILAVVLSVPFLLAARSAAPAPGAADVAALLLWLGGLAGETVADRQLRRWKADPANRGRTCRSGLWRYSRHPNYFFEWVIWIGFAVLGLSHEAGWVGLAAPALILFFILKVTGIPPTEAQALRSRGEDYRRYQQTTSAFFPWFPARENG